MFRLPRELKAQEPAALRDFDPSDVASGSKSDIGACPRNSALPPKTDMDQHGRDVC
jgi:hypothetical protein